MTLIVKELVVRGIVSEDNTQTSISNLDKEEMDQYLKQMKKDIEKECIEKVLQKVESKTMR